MQVTEDLKKSLNVHDEWVLTHRVDLHNALRSVATQGIDCCNIDIRLSSPVISVVRKKLVAISKFGNADQISSKDTENGEVVLEDGRKFVGDLVVGADGVHVSVPELCWTETAVNRKSPAL